MENRKFTAKPVIKDGLIKVEMTYRTTETVEYSTDEILEYLSSVKQRDCTESEITEGDVRDYVSELFTGPDISEEISEMKLLSMSVEI